MRIALLSRRRGLLHLLSIWLLVLSSAALIWCVVFNVFTSKDLVKLGKKSFFKNESKYLKPTNREDDRENKLRNMEQHGVRPQDAIAGLPFQHGSEEQQLGSNELDQPLKYGSVWGKHFVQDQPGHTQHLNMPLDVKIPYKMVHLDLKGAPPKMSYLTDVVLPYIQNAGGNAVLIEYEDMFPFEGPLRNISHRGHYTKEELIAFIGRAEQLSIEVIPLVQTFGHLEFVLKLKEFAHLREVENFPQELCPSNTNSFEVVKAMIDQVVHFHKNTNVPINYLHIGCDEVFHMGQCLKCRSQNRKELFLNHVSKVAHYVKNTHRIVPIIWDDILRTMFAEDIRQYNLGQLVDLMVWDYTENVDNLISPYLWPMYNSLFPNIWAASAFKGAFGETLHQVDIMRHARNQMSWLQVLNRETKQKPSEGRIKNLRGVVITGWSRYDHFAVLCELLPTAVPSMILTLLILQHQELSTALKELEKRLKCEFLSYSGLPATADMEACFWKGREIYAISEELASDEKACKAFLDSVKYERGWLTNYNKRFNETNPARLEAYTSAASTHLTTLTALRGEAEKSLRKIYPEFVVKEWVYQKFQGFIGELEALIKDAHSLSSRIYWDRRPISE